MHSITDQYQTLPMRQYAELGRSAGPAFRMLEVRQPEGDFSTPPARELTLIEPVSPGIRLSKRWGFSRFDGIAPLGTQWLVPAGCDVNLAIHTPHAIRILVVDPDALRKAADDEGAVGDFAAAHKGPLTDEALRSIMSAIWFAAPADRLDPLWQDAQTGRLLAALRALCGTPPVPLRGGLAARQMRIVSDLLSDPALGDVRIGDLARAVGLSPFHFARAFRASFGVPPYRYQKLARLHRARDLLSRTRLSILEVALAVGYSSAETLSRLFRAEMRMSPQQYRTLRLGSSF